MSDTTYPNDVVVEGIVQNVNHTKTPNGKSKTQVVVTIAPPWPGAREQPIAIDFWGRGTNMVEKAEEGQSVRIHAHLTGSLYKERFYVNLSGFKFEIMGVAPEMTGTPRDGSPITDAVHVDEDPF